MSHVHQPIESLERRILWAAGGLDTSFGVGGVIRDNVGSYASPDNIRDIAVDPAGRVYAVGTISDGPEYGTVLRRYLPDGVIDNSFGGGDGKVNLGINNGASDSIYAMAIASDGKIVLAGQHSYLSYPDNGALAVSHNDFGVFRFNENGSIDTTFGGGDGIADVAFDGYSEARAVQVLGDGKIVVVGDTRLQSDQSGTRVETTQLAVARLNADGSLDASFSGDGKLTQRVNSTTTYGWAVAVQDDGKTIVGGAAIIYGPTNTVRTALLRFNADGSLDGGFGAGGIVTGPAMGHMPGYRALAIDAQGRIVAGGADHNSPIIGRYNANGTLDTTFGDAGIVRYPGDDPVSELLFDADGNILAALNGTLMRFLSSGQVDATFGSDGVANTFGVSSERIALQPDGKIVAASSPGEMPANPDFLLARYHGGDGNTVINDDSGNASILVTQSGQRYEIPRPSRDGSMNIRGTEAPETITAERVTSLGAAQAGQYQLVYFNTSAGVVAVNLAAAREAATDGSALASAVAATRSYNVFRLEGVYEIYVSDTIVAGANARIRIDACGGNDVVAISNNVRMKSTLAGGWGADKLTSGSKRAWISGGGGGDRLFSRSRYGAILDGGKGADRYFNRFGECEIMGRCDGDCLVINDKVIEIPAPGVFGFSTDPATAGRSYYVFEGDHGQVDLLAGKMI